MRWSVYQLQGIQREAVGLGYVNGKNQPDALLRAKKRWPVSNLVVRQYAADYWSLGSPHGRERHKAAVAKAKDMNRKVRALFS